MREKLAGSLLSLSLVAIVSARAHAAEIQRVGFQGTGATVQFFGTAPLTCPDGSTGFVGVFGSLAGAEQVSSQTGVPKVFANGIFVSIDGYTNSCTFFSVSGANNFVENAFVPLDAKLRGTSMVGSTVVTDFNTGAQLSVSFDIDVDADGPLNTSKSTSKSKVRSTKGGPVTVNKSRTANNNRTGDAEGTLTIDGVVLNPDFSAVLFSSSSAQVTITR